jgi:hypothetical protein
VSKTQAQNCPNPPNASIASAQPPADVCIPNSFPENQNPIQFFDDYSWKTFVAMVWPVAPGERGQPDTSKTVAADGPRVFETLKAVWEIFRNDASTERAAWNDYEDAGFNACQAPVSFGNMVLASFSKFSDMGLAGFGSLIGPLVAQNRTYVRYVTGFNKVEFDQIISGQFFLRSKLPAAPSSLKFQDGAIDVKSSWILMSGIPHPERYYTRTALVMDPETQTCSNQTVGLVGLHIAQKTPTRPQWIWTTFEQVDNVPPADAGAPGNFNFNDGHGTAMPPSDPYPIDPLIVPPPAPFNVTRTLPINPSTVQTNAAYRKLMAAAGAKWQFYQLVMTQWPLTASDPTKPGTPANTFPGTGVALV